jgi:hypothetical protein
MAPSRYGPRSVDDLRGGEHICLFYENEEEHRDVLSSFIREGLEKGDKVVYLFDVHDPVTVLDYLSKDSRATIREGRNLAFSEADEVYLTQGIFDPDAMLELIDIEVQRALSEGYRALRITGEMTWSLKGAPGSERLIEYEADINNVFKGKDCIALCQYDKGRFGPDILNKALRTHPFVIDGTILYTNYFYLPPRRDPR